MPIHSAAHRFALTACVAALGLFGSAAHAQVAAVDLAAKTNGTYTTSSGSVTVSGQAAATFSVNAQQPAGTGVFNPFLRVQVTGSGTPQEASEQGYNTSTPNPQSVFDNKNPINWTHDVKFSDLFVVTQNNVQYYQFKLDINEPASATNGLLSLDGLRLFSTNTPSQNSTSQLANNCGTGCGVGGDWDWNGGSSAGKNTLLWDLDKGVNTTTGGGNTDPNNRYILLDRNRNGGGSGIADMVVLFEKNAIDAKNVLGQTNLILWSRFGIVNGAYDSGNSADGGFEEWSFQSNKAATNCSGTNCPGGGGGGSVPLPNTVLLVLLGMGLLGFTKGRHFPLMKAAA